MPTTLSNGKQDIKIYETTCRGKPLWQLSWYHAGRRQRRSFFSLAQAKREGRIILGQLENQRIEAEELSFGDMESYVTARRYADETGQPLDIVARDYAEAFKMLNGTPVSKAVEFFLRFHQHGEVKKVREYAEEYLEVCEKRGCSHATMLNKRSMFRIFCKKFGNMTLQEIDPKSIDLWFDKQKLSVVSVNTKLKALNAFANWVKTQKGFPKDEMTPFELATQRKEIGRSVGIFTVDEIQKLLQHTPPEMQAYMAIGAFAGMRASEISRLDWKDVHLDRGFIEAAAEKTKTRRRRLVPICENLKAWLMPVSQSKGRIVNFACHSQQTLSIAKKAEVKWVKNGLRHSYISYRLALMPDTARVALECGNSPDIIFKHYRELVREEDAKAWFGIMPA